MKFFVIKWPNDNHDHEQTLEKISVEFTNGHLRSIITPFLAVNPELCLLKKWKQIHFHFLFELVLTFISKVKLFYYMKCQAEKLFRGFQNKNKKRKRKIKRERERERESVCVCVVVCVCVCLRGRKKEKQSVCEEINSTICQKRRKQYRFRAQLKKLK